MASMIPETSDPGNDQPRYFSKNFFRAKRRADLTLCIYGDPVFFSGYLVKINHSRSGEYAG
jgi:hypothetical protein